MAKDKDGRPILTASDWKTGEDRKKESPAVTIWGAIWRALLPLGLIAIVGLIYRIQTQEEGESRSFTEGVQIFGPILGIIGLPLFGYLVYAIYFDGQCPNCKRRKAIEKTDETRSTDGFWSSTDEEKYKCKYCGFAIWAKDNRDTGGGGCGS